MSACVGIFGRLFGHKFRARYSEGAPTITSIDRASVHAAIQAINATKSITYHGDVCVRCGLSINGRKP